MLEGQDDDEDIPGISEPDIEVLAHCAALLSRPGTRELGLSGLLMSVLSPPSNLLGLAELAMEKTPESAWEAGESLLLFSRGDSFPSTEIFSLMLGE